MKQIIPLLVVVLAMPSMIASSDLGFIIDISGSMGDEIGYLKSKVIEIMHSDVFSVVDYYIITTFSDPYVKRSIKSKDRAEVTNFLNALTASGDGDCPEYAMTGTLEAISLASDNSLLFLFTDAPAKDAARASEVLDKAQRKNLTIFSGLTGSCASGAAATAAIAPYKTISDGTGAKQWEFKARSNVDTLLKQLVKLTGLGKIHLAKLLPANFNEVITADATGEYPAAIEAARLAEPSTLYAKSLAIKLRFRRSPTLTSSVIRAPTATVAPAPTATVAAPATTTVAAPTTTTVAAPTTTTVAPAPTTTVAAPTTTTVAPPTTTTVAPPTTTTGAAVFVCWKFFTFTAVLAAFLARMWHSY